MWSNYKVERRGRAQWSIEADLSGSSTCIHGSPKLFRARSLEPWLDGTLKGEHRAATSCGFG